MPTIHGLYVRYLPFRRWRARSTLEELKLEVIYVNDLKLVAILEKDFEIGPGTYRLPYMSQVQAPHRNDINLGCTRNAGMQKDQSQKY